MTSESAAFLAAGAIPRVRDVAVRDDANTDLELVVRAKEADTEAFSELVNRHQQMVYNLAYRFMRDPVLAEDVAQEAFIKAYRLLGGFRGDCTFSTWLYRVTASVCLNEIERRKRRAEVELLPSHEMPEVPERLERLDVPEMMRHCVDKLPGRYQKIVTLYYLKEISYDDIARIMKIPSGTLKTWMYRARAQLRKILEREYEYRGLD